MKNTGIKGINTAGLIGYIISVLLSIAIIATMVITGIGTAGAIAIADKEIKVNMSTAIDISSTGDFLGTLNKFMKVGEVENLEDIITEDGKTVKVNDSDLSELSAYKTENGFLVNAKTNEKVITIKNIIINLVATFIFLLTAEVAVHFLASLMKALRKCETPFCDSVIKSMSRFAISLIPAVCLNMLCGGLWSSLGNRGEFGMTVNLSSVLLVAVIFLLIAVFKYGAQLQQESDETL
jgi:hypothetical protein